MSKPRLKRFYKDVGIAPQDGAFVVKLDGRTLKTPGKLTLTAPSKNIATLVAKEWQAQEIDLQPETMPVTRLLNVALELTPENRPKLIDEARSYAATDVLCYRDKPGALARHQTALWDPVLVWAAKRGISLKTEASVMAVDQAKESLDAVADFAAELDDIKLTLFLHLTAVFGSAVLALTVLEGHLSGPKAFELSRLDAQWQIDQWGEDEEDKERSESIAAEVASISKILKD